MISWKILINDVYKLIDLELLQKNEIIKGKKVCYIIIIILSKFIYNRFFVLFNNLLNITKI